MKRCSQCDFVYEDDQARCDMDGGELVYEPTLYPAAQTAMVVAQPPIKFRSRSFMLTTAATVIMGAFLGIGFLGFSGGSQSTTPATNPASVPPPVIVQPAMAATSSETTPSSESSPSSDATPSSDASSSPHKSTVIPAANVKSRNAAAPSVSASAKPAPAASRSPVPTETKPAPTKAKQEDSKVGSLLKKTGRILKKPFRKW